MVGASYALILLKVSNFRFCFIKSFCLPNKTNPHADLASQHLEVSAVHMPSKGGPHAHRRRANPRRSVHLMEVAAPRRPLGSAVCAGPGHAGSRSFLGVRWVAGNVRLLPFRGWWRGRSQLR